MRAVIITAVVIVLILAIGIPVIHYTTKDAPTAAVSAKNIVGADALRNRPAQTTPTGTPQAAGRSTCLDGRLHSAFASFFLFAAF